MAMILSASDLTCGYASKPVLKNVSFSAAEGKCLCILGPNGVGKTTLFKTVLGLLPAISGAVTIDGEDILKWPEKKRARMIAYVPQSHVPPFPYTVRQVVVMGRCAYLGLMSSPSAADFDIADAIMEHLGILHLAGRIYTNISGGERQMALIARALAQEPAFLMMDEPASSLDYGNQAIVLRQARQLAAEGIAVIMTTHTPDHAFLLDADAVLIKRDGTLLAGSSDSVVTEENLSDAYNIPVCIIEKERDGRLVKSCVPML